MQSYPNQQRQLELWGGIECTRNRVEGQYFDQLERSGHNKRIDDLRRIAELGIRTLRYPVLWECAAPDDAKRIDWTWATERLNALRQLQVCPIVGFVHHGSGPAYTNLLDPEFATGLAYFAEQFARQAPWVDLYTPVNEPLTTARFSALYGHWYPHEKDSGLFAQAMMNQCRAIVLSMQQIRAVNSDTRLVQTEDLGKTYSDQQLAYQAEFENERRWLTFDLLCGRVDRHHPIGAYLLWLGVTEQELMWFQANPCPPDIFGINYYVTSERFLDSRVEEYPNQMHGSNGRHSYVDLEAVRIHPDGIAGAGLLLREAFERYHGPLAITECHLGCSREEQLRWLWECWQGAKSAKESGADVRAVTVWALLGAFDWDSLVTLHRGHYEAGAFDVRAMTPRPTALAKLVKELALGEKPTCPVLEQAGWWRRPERLLHAPPVSEPLDGRPLLITGATGTLGRAFARICDHRKLSYRLLGRNEMDIADRESVARTIEQLQPWAVINAAGYVRVDEAEREPAHCFRENILGPITLATECSVARIPLLTFSSDLVFDGKRRSPYEESNEVNPLGVYGRSKAEAESRVLDLLDSALVVRTSAFFGPWDQYNFIAVALRALNQGGVFGAADDAIVSPTYVPDLVHTCLDLLLDGANGIWHLANQAEISWADFARQAAERAGFDPRLIEARSVASFGWTAMRPLYCALGTERAVTLPPLEDALDRYFFERRDQEPVMLVAANQG